MTINIAFVGTGYIADIHLKCLAKIKDVRIAAFCNHHLEKAQEIAAKYQAGAYSDCREMLEHEKLDAVYVCIPPFAHQGQEELIIERNLPMFVEKPISLNLAAAEKINRLVTQKGVITSVGYIFRYLDIIEELQNVLSGRKISMCLARYSGTMPGVYWWGKKHLGGGQILEQSTHVFDLMRMLTGEAAAIQAFANTGIMKERKDYDVEDSSVVNLHFANNVIGSIASNCLYPNGAVVALDVIGDAFRAELSLLDGKMKLIDNSGCREIAGAGLDDAFMKENIAFVNAVKTGDVSGIKSTYQDAFLTHQLTLQAMDSLMNQGKLNEMKG